MVCLSYLLFLGVWLWQHRRTEKKILNGRRGIHFVSLCRLVPAQPHLHETVVAPSPLIFFSFLSFYFFLLFFFYYFILFFYFVLMFTFLFIFLFIYFSFFISENLLVYKITLHDIIHKCVEICPISSFCRSLSHLEKRKYFRYSKSKSY